MAPRYLACSVSQLWPEMWPILRKTLGRRGNVEFDPTMPNALAPLTTYDVSAVSGFVPELDPVDGLTGFDPWEEVASELSALIRTRRLRTALAGLPELDISRLETVGERERGLLLLTVFANGWVWGGDEPNLVIPQQISRPLCALAESMGRPPIVHYASMALHNWRRLDRKQPISADNVRMQVQFLGGVDEDWFFVGSLGVEIAGAPLVGTVHAAVDASMHLGDEELQTATDQISSGMQPVIDAMNRMSEWCDPHVFYHRVRPYLRGWPSPGVLYEGVAQVRQTFVGGSAGQSSLIQAVDAVLGVRHEQPAADYLRTLRTYMPPAHRRLVEDIESLALVRSRAQTGSSGLRAAYNEALAQVDQFRRRHIALAVEYVVEPSGGEARNRGTGGTELEAFLSRARSATTSARL